MVVSDVKYCFVRPEVGLDTPICQYLDLDYLLRLLTTNKYFVRCKNCFSDKNEKLPPLKDMFPVYPADKKPDKSILERDMTAFEDKLALCKKRGHLPASCWTLRNKESDLMWSGYTTKLGACIRSTVRRFITAIDYTGYKLMYGRMSYNGYGYYQENELFSKDPAFADEEELRFYFVPEDSSEMPEDNVYLKAEAKDLIDEIILSPRIEPVAASELRTMLSEKYGVRIVPSMNRIDA